MKKTLRLALAALVAFGMFACGEKKMTEDDLKKAEATLFDDNMRADDLVAASVVEKYCRFAKQNPDDPASPDWLFKALEISVSQKDAKKCEEICHWLMEQYPTYEKTPFGMFMMASLVYDDQLKELGKAKALYEKIIAEYPESEITPSAEASLGFLGMSPEEIIRQFEAAEAAVTEE